jgi:hypothetical protein
MTSKLSGALFRKAIMEKSFEKVYERVFVQISTKVFEDDVHILEIFGDVGG